MSKSTSKGSYIADDANGSNSKNRVSAGLLYVMRKQMLTTLRLRIKRASFWCVTIAVPFLFAFLLAEALFRSLPEVLPVGYRSQLPGFGLDLKYPGILERTPISSIPLPYNMLQNSAYSGPPPQDLVTLGLLPSALNPDLSTYPKIVVKRDRFGLTNASFPRDADILLLGDSFAAAGGVLEPKGLQRRLSELTGKSIYNTGIPGASPQHSLSMYNVFAPLLEPEIVVLLLFSGNDLADSATIVAYQASGIRNYSDLYQAGSYTNFHSLELIRWAFSKLGAAINRGPQPSVKEGVSPFVFEIGALRHEIWFHPAYVRSLRYDEGYWAAHPGLEPALVAIEKIRADVESRGGNFFAVYIPSKPEIYLRVVTPDAEKLRLFASFDNGDRLQISADGLWQQSLAHSRAQEVVLERAMNARGVPFLSLSPRFSAEASAGKLLYLSADTHWNELGQQVAAEEIAQFISDSKKACR